MDAGPLRLFQDVGEPGQIAAVIERSFADLSAVGQFQTAQVRQGRNLVKLVEQVGIDAMETATLALRFAQ